MNFLKKPNLPEQPVKLVLAAQSMDEAIKNELENKELYEVKLPIELPISKINLIYIREQLTQSDKKFIKNYLKN